MTALTKTETIVIEALVVHNSMREEVTLSSLASECNVAKSTVVKAIQKLGFAGFQDYRQQYVVHASKAPGFSFSQSPVTGSPDDAASELATVFERSAGRKNIIYPTGGRKALSLAGYLSRKLTMFELFFVTSNDFAFMGTRELEPGYLIAFNRGRSAEAGENADHARDAYWIERARSLGYSFVVFSDAPSMPPALSRGAVVIDVSPNVEEGCDLFSTKVISVFEQALAELAARRKAGVRGDGARPFGEPELLGNGVGIV